MQRGHWQLTGSTPELYETYLVPAITSVWARDLIERIGPRPGEAVLDIACGTGAVTRRAAECVKEGRVVGLDFNPGMLAVARSVASSEASIEWVEGSALDLPFADGEFDIVLCQLGLQFFPNQPRALCEMKRVLASSGRAALSVYSAIENTPAACAFVRALDERFGRDASQIKRSEHSFVDADALGILMTMAGFADVHIKAVTQEIKFPSVLDYVRFQLLATPMAQLLDEFANSDRDAIVADVALRTGSYLDASLIKDGAFCFPQQAFVAISGQPD